ncbi:MAG: 2,3-bisphosphoglycerate-independent phosphoglycerate mutase [Acetobacteraceae bacterium]|nr:2,3-bisphosphoglycerate-independent phosphoglycerate mutase [Acetobacteraceae bacterium]
MRQPVMLVILDGWGWREERADNAVRLANTPNFNKLWETCPHAFLHPSGLDVGLPAGQMGNSEVGHLNLGAGRVVMQDLPRINQACADGTIATLPALVELVAKMKASGGTCHLMGLASEGGVHAHLDHALALAGMLHGHGIPIAVHAWLDGRDTPPQSAQADLAKLAAGLPAGARIVTVSGRYFAMDRDNRWDRTSRAYLAMAEAEAPRVASPAEVVAQAYAAGTIDEFVEPAVVGDYGGMKDGDGLLCFNFRTDRVRQVFSALLDPGFSGFARPRAIAFAAAAGMTFYSDALAPYMTALFAPVTMDHLLGEEVAAAGLKQIRLAETEKYPHVTYFFNGGVETPNPGEDRVMIPSPKVATYDLQPEMSAPALTDAAVKAIGGGEYAMLVLNFANPDMVGHTGSLTAAIKAVETVDTALGRIVAAIAAQDGWLLVTADHGNCEMMRDPATGGPHTAHTTNPVPVLLFGPTNRPLADGRLADIAPTMLELMGLAVPPEMTGRSLLATGSLPATT